MGYARIYNELHTLDHTLGVKIWDSGGVALYYKHKPVDMVTTIEHWQNETTPQPEWTLAFGNVRVPLDATQVDKLRTAIGWTLPAGNVETMNQFLTSLRTYIHTGTDDATIQRTGTSHPSTQED